MTSPPHAAASRWFNVWIGTWIAFMVTMFLSAGSDKLTAGNVVPTVIVNGAVLVLAVVLAFSVRDGRRIGGATALLGFFAMAGLVPLGIIAAGQIRHAHTRQIPVPRPRAQNVPTSNGKQRRMRCASTAIYSFGEGAYQHLFRRGGRSPKRRGHNAARNVPGGHSAAEACGEGWLARARHAGEGWW